MMCKHIYSLKFYIKNLDLNMSFYENKKTKINKKHFLLLLITLIYLISFKNTTQISKNNEMSNPLHTSKLSSSKFKTKTYNINNNQKQKQKPLGNLLNIFSVFKNSKEKSNKNTKYDCLEIPKNILNQKNFSLEKLNYKSKMEFFQKGKCNPVVLIPGIFGTKLEFVLEDCKQFKEFHKNIMDSCGWDDCESDAFPKKFKIWLEIGAEKAIQKVMKNVKNNFFSFLNLNENEKNGDSDSEDDNNKYNKDINEYYIPSMLKYFDINGNKIFFNNKPNTEKCFGNLFRLYYTKEESNNNSERESENNINTNKNYTINKNKKNKANNENETIPTENPKIKVLKKLKGAEIRVLLENPTDCGADAVSDFAKPYSQYLSKSLLGFESINKSLADLGYTKGLSLFNAPYDFRFQMAEIIPKIQETIQLAYKINKKKVILIGHSYGGLLAYKLSTLKEKELIEHAVVIGAPLLGSFQAVKNTFGVPEDFGYEKNLEIFGKKIGKIQTGFPAESMRIATASFNLLQFFPKEIKKDESYQLIIKISELENLHKLNHRKSKNNNSDDSSVGKNINNNNNNKKNYQKKFRKLVKKDADNRKGTDFFSLMQLKDKESEEVLRKFYEVFPKPNEQCKGIERKHANKVLTEESNLCKINFFDAQHQPLLEIESKANQNTNIKQTKKKIPKSIKNENTQKLILGFSSSKDQKENSSFNKNTYSGDISLIENKNISLEKIQHLKNLFLKNKLFREKFNLMNNNPNLNKIFKISYEEYIDYLIASQEKELFETYPYPNIEFTFIFSNAFKTSATKKINLTKKSKKLTTNEKTLKAIPGDQSIHAFSSIYPGLNWLLLSLKNPKKHPYNKGIHFVEFCSKFDSKNLSESENKQNKRADFIHGKNQFIALECECMGKDLVDEEKAEDCNHAAMINDKFLVEFLSEIVTKGGKGKVYEAQDDEFNMLFLKKFEDEMFCENYRDLYADNNKNNEARENREDDLKSEGGFSLSNILNFFK